MPFDPKRTAVVLIEYQNDFTSEGGALHDAVRGVMDQTGMLDNTRELVEVARAAAPGHGDGGRRGDADKPRDPHAPSLRPGWPAARVGD